MYLKQLHMFVKKIEILYFCVSKSCDIFFYASNFFFKLYAIRENRYISISMKSTVSEIIRYAFAGSNFFRVNSGWVPGFSFYRCHPREIAIPRWRRRRI